MGQTDPVLEGWIQVNGPPPATKEKDLERGNEPEIPRVWAMLERYNCFFPMVRCIQKIAMGQLPDKREAGGAVLGFLVLLLNLFLILYLCLSW